MRADHQDFFLVATEEGALPHFHRRSQLHPGDAQIAAYDIAVKRDLNGVRAVQYFYLVAGQSGEQAMLTFTTTPGQIQKLGSRDLEFVRGFELRKATEK
jgi:predicted exporter